MNKSQIYRLGFYTAICGCESIDDCPYKDSEWVEKRIWVLGFIEGIHLIWSGDDLRDYKNKYLKD